MNDILEYQGYYGEVHFSADDNCFIGEVTGINDIVIFQGETVEELKNSFHQSVNDYLEFCKELGKDPDKTYKGSFNVRVPSEVHRNAALIAAIKKVSLNDFVRSALEETIKKEKQQLHFSK
jgi:predicted HicB family RNase H-like nuclease